MSGLSLHAENFVPLDEFLRFLLPSVHNAPVEVAMHYVREAAIEFATHTACLKDFVPIDLQANVIDYEVPCLNDQVYVWGLKSVSYRGKPLCRLPGHPVQNTTLFGPGYWFEAPSEIYILPRHAFDIPHGVTVEVLLQPTQDATSLPRKLYDEYAEQLAFGAMNRLLSMKEADWFDGIEANKQWKKFRDAKNTAKRRVEKGDSTEPMIARAPRWA